MPRDTTRAGIAHIHQKYRPEIDGLRAVAVLIVLCCHAGFAGFSGGFIGVDIFFAISGFVVANSIVGDLERNQFSFKKFYARRAVRLAPAMYVVLTATFLFCLLFIFPDDVFKVAKNILAVATMTSNIYLSKQTGYFDAKAAEQPLLHTWSLSVEEQFYLALPVLMFMLRRSAWARVLPVLLACAALSYGAAVVGHKSGQSGAYYFAQTRAFEFLAGVGLSVFERHRHGEKHGAFDVLFIAGLGVIALGVAGVSRQDQFPGYGALLPCIATVAIMFVGRRTRYAHKLLDNHPCVYLGRISYPLYLWHWPVLFALHRLDLSGPITYAAALTLILTASAVTHRLELAVQRRRWSARRALTGLVVLPIVGAGALTGIGKLTDGFLFAYPKATQENVRWSGTALFDMPRARTCWSQVGISSQAECTVGAVSSPHRAVLWGDSHAYHLVHFFDELGKDRGIAVHDVAYTLCPPVETTPERAVDPAFNEQHAQCAEHDKRVMGYLLASPDVRTVFMSAAWQNYQNLSAGPDARPNVHGYMPGQFEDELAKTIARLQSAGKQIVLLDDVPMIPQEMVNCEFYNGLWIPYPKRACRFDSRIAREQHAPVAAMQARIQSRFPAVKIIHTFDVPCDAEKCRLEFDGLPIYRYSDYHHLSLAGSTKYYREYRRKHPAELDRLGL